MEYVIQVMALLLIVGVCGFSWYNWRWAVANNRAKRLSLLFMILSFIGALSLLVALIVEAFFE